MGKQARSAAICYGVAVVSIALATAVRLAMSPVLQERIPFATYFVAILFTAWFSGWRPAVVALLLGAAVAGYLFIKPVPFFSVQSTASFLALLLYLIVGASLIAVVEWTKRAQERAEKNAREVDHQRERFRVTLASIGDGVVVTDMLGRVTFINSIAEQLTGWTAAEAVGTGLDRVFQIINEDTREPAANPVFRAISAGRVVGLANHTILISKDGREFSIDDSAAPIQEADRTSIGVVLVFRDVSEKRREAKERRQVEDALRESEDRFRAIADNAPAAIFIKDLAGRYVFANPTAAESLGRKDGGIGLTDHELMDVEAADKLRQHDLEVVASGRPLEREEVVRTSAGERWYLSIKFPMRNAMGEIAGVGGVAIDISARKQADDAQAWLAAIVASSQDAIISKTLEGIITSWNVGAERIFGYSADEVIGRPVTLLIPPDRQNEEQEILSRLRRNERIEHYETIRMTKDGQMIDVSLTVSPIRDRTGRVVGASKIARNISERTKADTKIRESETRFRLLADNVPALIWVDDEAGRCTFANARYKEYVGMNAEVLSDEWHRIIHPEDRERYLATYREAAEHRSEHRGQMRMRRHDGVYRWFDVIGIPRYEGGEFAGYVGCNIDFTERRQAELALRDADRRKDEFLAMLAHELRNPLTPIRSGLDMLTAGMTLPRDNIQLMQHQVEHLVRLVDDLLDVSRIMRGRIELRKRAVEVGTVVRQAAEAVQKTVAERSQELTVRVPDEPTYLEADPVRLTQILENLLNNSCKYTDPGGRIELSAERQGEEIILQVHDTGIGIDPELLPKVFELFAQTPRSLDRSQGGLGIGLTLVKSLAKIHGGTVSAHSDGPGKGSTFVVRLPIGKPTPPETTEASPSPVAGRRRILLVDDNVGAARMLSVLLTKLHSQEVAVEYDGASALKTIVDFRPDIVLLDIGLPGLDGYQVGSRIRENSEFNDVLLVALTGYGQAEDRRKSAEAGFDEHVVKPPSADDLKRILSHPKLSRLAEE